MSDTSYSTEAIELLAGLDPVRKRPEVVLAVS